MLITEKEIIKLLELKKDNKQELRELLRYYFSDKRNIAVFSKFFFPKAITTEVPRFHQNIYDELFKNDNSAIAAPRGYGKSTILGLIFLIYCIVYNLEKYIVYISQSHTKTVQFLDPIRFNLKSNEWLRFVYGDLTPKHEKDDQGKDRQDCFDVNNIRVEAVSFEKNLRGFKYRDSRPSLLVIDDAEDDKRVINPELRKRDENKLNQVIIPSLDINGKYKFIGTIIHIDSLLSKKLKLLNGRTYSGCDENLNSLLWPERFTKEKLQELRKEIGSLAFQREILNNPVGGQSSIINPNDIEEAKKQGINYSITSERKPWMKRVVCGCDFAFSMGESANYSAFVTVAEIEENKWIVLDYWKKRNIPKSQQLNVLAELHKKYNYDAVACELNSVQAITDDMSQFNLPLKFYWTGSTDPKPGRRQKYYKTISKDNAIGRLATDFEPFNKKIIFPYSDEDTKRKMNELGEELLSWATDQNGKLIEVGVHVDAGIGLILALEELRIVKKVGARSFAC